MIGLVYNIDPVRTVSPTESESNWREKTCTAITRERDATLTFDEEFNLVNMSFSFWRLGMLKVKPTSQLWLKVYFHTASSFYLTMH